MLGNFKRRLRNIFITGLLITVPIAFTYFILNFLFTKLDNLLSPAVTKILIYYGAPLSEGFRIPGLGVTLTVLIIFLVGVFTTNIFGKKLLTLGEKIVAKIPIVRNIYTGTKQVVTTIAQADTDAFREVVLIEFPRKGLYAVAFVTTPAKGEIRSLTGDDFITVFVPTTPNPTSGFLIFTSRTKVTKLSMTIEEGIKLVISGGIVTPAFNPDLLKGVEKIKTLKDSAV